MTIELTNEEIETLLETLELARYQILEESEGKFAPEKGTHRWDLQQKAKKIAWLEYKIGRV